MINVGARKKIIVENFLSGPKHFIKTGTIITYIFNNSIDLPMSKKKPSPITNLPLKLEISTKKKIPMLRIINRLLTEYFHNEQSINRLLKIIYFAPQISDKLITKIAA